MPYELIPLGTNGFIPTHGRQTMSFLVVGEGQALLLDAGTGAGRLLGAGLQARLRDVPRLDILLTHYHLDHVVGLSYLGAFWRDRPVRLHAPRRPLVDADPEEALGRLLGPPLFPVRLGEFAMPIEVVPYAGPTLEIGALRLRLRRQNHPGGSVGVRIGDQLAYCTDTLAEDATSEFARGAGTLLHEVWLTDAEAAAGVPAYGHSAVSGVAGLARAARVGRLMPIHHHPSRTRSDLAQIAASLAEGSGVEVLLPQEGHAYPLG